MKFCRICGTEMPDNAIFCTACGTPFEEDDGTTVLAQEEGTDLLLEDDGTTLLTQNEEGTTLLENESDSTTLLSQEEGTSLLFNTNDESITTFNNSKSDFVSNDSFNKTSSFALKDDKSNSNEKQALLNNFKSKIIDKALDAADLIQDAAKDIKAKNDAGEKILPKMKKNTAIRLVFSILLPAIIVGACALVYYLDILFDSFMNYSYLTVMIISLVALCFSSSIQIWSNNKIKKIASIIITIILAAITIFGVVSIIVEGYDFSHMLVSFALPAVGGLVVSAINCFKVKNAGVNIALSVISSASLFFVFIFEELLWRAFVTFFIF